jgi:SAM-dependent methyltransferase
MPDPIAASATPTKLSCLFCGAAGLWEFSEFPALPRVTSDCRPYPPGGRLLVCRSCSVVQKVPDERWTSEIAGIYATYEMYKQADGAEQSVLDPATNQFELRSDLIVRHLDSRLPYRDGARVLDVGCGTGVTLEALARSTRRLRLFGLEFDERNLQRLERIRGFEKLFLGELRDIPLDFDLVTLVHALEHFPHPAQALASAADRMSPGAAMFVQVVDSPRNPFDLVIADHMGHFSANTLRALAQRQGLKVLDLEPNLVRRELAMICDRSAGAKLPFEAVSEGEGIGFAAKNLNWLSTVLRESAQAASEYTTFGLFGSSIAATWLADALGDRVKFFVDEDPARIGRRHLDRPIVPPRDIPAGAGVYVGMAPVSAEAVVNRFSGSAVKLIAPPRIALS